MTIDETGERPAVVVTQTEFAKADRVFRAADDLVVCVAPRDETAVAEAVLQNSARAVIVGTASYSDDLYAALGHVSGEECSLIARFGVGFDNIDLACARRHNVLVTNTPGVLAQSVAEHVFWLLGAAVRSLVRADGDLRSGLFQGTTGMEIAGKTMGIIGFGNVGRRVARIARFGFGMRVLAAGRRDGTSLEMDEGRDLEDILTECGVESYADQPDDLLAESDVVSLHLPATEATRAYIDQRRLRMMQPSAVLINTARGGLIDEPSLCEALAGQRLAAAGLDVFSREPYVAASPRTDLRRFDNVVMSPHVGSNTWEANRRMASAALENVRSFLGGRYERLTLVDRLKATAHTG